jgi:peptidylamidoglycolate lyase
MGFLFLLALLAPVSHAHFLELNITVPQSYKVVGDDQYVCTVVELPSSPQKLVGVIPLAEQSVVHHILLFGECLVRY